MKLTEEMVLVELKRNPNYDSFLNEFEGKFSLHYVISNIPIVIFNEIGGSINGYFKGECNCTYDDITLAQNFLRIAISHFNNDNK